MRAMNKYLLILLMLVSANAFSELNKWVDANGQVHYSDIPPPPDANTKTLRTTPGIMGSRSAGESTAASAATAPKTMAEREVELKKAQRAKKEAADKAAKKRADSEANKDRCAALQKNLRALQEGIRMVELDANGNQFFIDDEQRQQRIAKTQQDISANCK
ncbi:MAG: hypothetical protein A3K04_11425 [Gallionellales bacterium RBG_16_56_9]|nr:MAG: hypothetical protein A3K04_11425 [Gallionellales bacterium RBG_16_56_9]